jgi:hypothetical protein
MSNCPIIEDFQIIQDNDEDNDARLKDKSRKRVSSFGASPFTVCFVFGCASSLRKQTLSILRRSAKEPLPDSFTQPYW